MNAPDAPPPLRPPGEEEALTRAWSSPPGWRSLSAVNYRPLGRRFVLTALVFFLVAGLLALLMRARLAVPHNTVLGPETYNQVFTMHGTVISFLFAVRCCRGRRRCCCRSCSARCTTGGRWQRGACRASARAGSPSGSSSSAST